LEIICFISFKNSTQELLQNKFNQHYIQLQQQSSGTTFGMSEHKAKSEKFLKKAEREACWNAKDKFW
jgi:hypothetical protein